MHTHERRHPALATGRISTGFRVAGPLHVRVIEYGVREHLVGGQYHLKRISLQSNIIRRRH